MSDNDGLSADEQAYFASGGEKDPPVQSGETQEAPEVTESAPEADVAGEAAEGAAEGQQPAAKEPEKVPLATLLEERRNSKEARERLREIERQNTLLMERWNKALEASQPQQQAQDEDPEPDPNVDIFGHNAWLARQFKKQQDAAQQQAQHTAEQQRHQQIESTVWQYWQQDSAEFAAKAPDFGEAATFLAGTRDAELKSLAKVDQRYANKAFRDQVINGDLKQIVIAAAQQGVSPAEMVYGIAQERGYKRAAPQGDGGKQIEALAQNMEAAKSLGSTPGGKVPTLSAEAILAMPDKEFAAWYAKPENQEKFRRIQGG